MIPLRLLHTKLSHPGEIQMYHANKHVATCATRNRKKTRFYGKKKKKNLYVRHEVTALIKKMNVRHDVTDMTALIKKKK